MHHIHFVGIGGIGMSALARYYKSQGWQVTGSDAADSSVIEGLRREGITVHIGHHATQISETIDRVIVSLAVHEKNSELRTANALKIPVSTYAEAIGELTRRYTTIAVSGSHGKSTTTALIGLILTRAGLDPTIIVGTNLQELGGVNFRAGKSEYLVLEADEWGKSFHHYAPQIAVLTNIDKEHLDIYKNYAGVIKGFTEYLRNVPPGGVIVANGGSKGVVEAIEELRSKNNPPERLKSFSRAGEVRIKNDDVIWYNKTRFAKHKMGIPGRHNQENAEAAWQVAHYLGIKKKIADEVFKNYTGSWRRFEELRSKNKEVRIKNKELVLRSILYTDYAHHPTEIRATLEGAREMYPKKKIICVFEPHQADRLTRLFKDFTHAFSEADETIILPVYRVLGREEKSGEKTSRDLVKRIGRKGIVYRENLKKALEYLESDLKNPDAVIIFMSAGNLDAEVRRVIANNAN